MELRALYVSGAMNGQGWTLGYTWSSILHAAGVHEGVGLQDGIIYWIGDAGTVAVSCVR